MFRFDDVSDYKNIKFLRIKSGITVTTGQKNWIAKCFERFPKMFEYIKSDDFVYKTFKKDPFSVLDKLGTLK